jgi:crotonobetainyl-CoA:carnitine CoA-transferase CaiB-like acyl-CoA transferase
MTAFGQEGAQTAYDHAIQATSGITASTGTEASGPIKTGAPMVDYATGTMGAFAISAALFQRMRTGRGQYVDLAMLDVAMILQASHVTDYLHSGHHPRRAGNVMRFASTSAFPAREGMIQLAASNARQHRRFYEAIGDPDEAKRDSLEERHERQAEKLASCLDCGEGARSRGVESVHDSRPREAFGRSVEAGSRGPGGLGRLSPREP